MKKVWFTVMVLVASALLMGCNDEGYREYYSGVVNGENVTCYKAGAQHYYFKYKCYLVDTGSE